MMKMYKIICLGFVSILFLSFINDTSKKYLKTEALPGDGVYSILRRYKLYRFSCNHDKFYKINKLPRNAPLIVGRTYKLPVLVYKYNGKSIRSTIGLNDWNRAIRIQNYNVEMVERKLRAKNFTKNRELWVPFHELKCPQADIPMVQVADPEMTTSRHTKPRHYSIFGDKYAYTPLESQTLQGQVFYIVSGHGGPDPGARGKFGGHTLCEDEYAYDVALRLVRMLIANGATAYVINRDLNDGIRSGKYLECDQDEVVWGNLKLPLNQKARLFQRSDAINDLYKKNRLQGVTQQTVICIHVDSRSKGMQTDVFFYYHPDSPQGKRLANKLHKTFLEKYRKYRRSGEYFGTVTPRDLHMLRECKPPTVYIELGNIKNSFDQQRIVLESNRQALAKWLYEGLAR